MTEMTENVMTNEINRMVKYMTNILVLILMLFHSSLKPVMALSPCIHHTLILMFLAENVKRVTGFSDCLNLRFLQRFCGGIIICGILIFYNENASFLI